MPGGDDRTDVSIVEHTKQWTTLRWFSATSGALQRTLRLPSATVGVEGVARLDGEVLFISRAGDVTAYPSGAELGLRPPRRFHSHEEGSFRSLAVFGAGAELYIRHDKNPVARYQPDIDTKVSWDQGGGYGIWASGPWILRNQPWVWDVEKRDGTGGRVLAFEGTSQCGHPLMGAYALALDANEGELALTGLSLAEGPPDWTIPGVPLERGHCVAGEDGLFAVTGRQHGQPTVAIYHKDSWHTVTLPSSPGILEPLVSGGRVIVSSPEETWIAGTSGETREGAGAVYILERQGEAFGIRERIVDPAPRERGLFGFGLHVASGRLFIDYLANSLAVDGQYFGEPMVCTVDL